LEHPVVLNYLESLESEKSIIIIYFSSQPNFDTLSHSSAIMLSQSVIPKLLSIYFLVLHFQLIIAIGCGGAKAPRYLSDRNHVRDATVVDGTLYEGQLCSDAKSVLIDKIPLSTTTNAIPSPASQSPLTQSRSSKITVVLGPSSLPTAPTSTSYSVSVSLILTPTTTRPHRSSSFR
jgi:hypothetical protein